MYTTPQSKQESDSHLAPTVWSSDRGILQDDVNASVRRRRPMSGQDNIHSASFVDHADSSSGRDGILGGKDRDLSRIKRKRRQDHPGLWEVTQEPGRIREEESQTSTFLNTVIK